MKKECAVEKMRGKCVSMYVLECASLCANVCVSHVVRSLHREVILAYGLCAVLRSVRSWSLQVSLPCSDMKTIRLTADLSSAPQDKCLTRSSLPESKLDDSDKNCI